ncbi:MAG: AAA family ATPase [Candidatus Omnitrophica bacterium]|nr:AAA family ATPase [Candidatus Omnitrophota bacterium]
MVKSIQLCLIHSGRINGRRQIAFAPGFNVVVGPNGSGKSSLLKAIYECSDCKKINNNATTYHYFDSETMNPHRSEEPFRGVHGSIIRVRAMFSSHGETMRDVLRFLNFKEGDTLLLDEPEAGHDFQWILKIRKGLEKISRMGCQVVVASHHPVFWDAENIVELKRGYRKRTLDSFGENIVQGSKGRFSDREK